MKTNYHTHTTWCDGKDSPEAVVLSAIAKGFDAIGFSSHAMLPSDPLPWPVGASRLASYTDEIKGLAAKYASRIRVLCGIEADFVRDRCLPSRSMYGGALDYIIGSVHFTAGPDGRLANVDKSPESFLEDVHEVYGGSVRAFVCDYFAAVREMVADSDCDVVGHADLIRKFNPRLGFLDESSPWYLAELEATADAIARSGKLVEVNTGAISRGWMDDAYPSAQFRAMLRERNVRFILSSDAHSAAAIDCAFDRFSSAEAFVHPW